MAFKYIDHKKNARLRCKSDIYIELKFVFENTQLLEFKC